MKKVMLGVSFALSAGLISHSFAASHFPLSQLSKKSSSPSITLKNKAVSSEHADLSGFWEGYCFYENVTDVHQLRLVTNDKEIKIGPFVFQLGIFNTQSSSDEDGTRVVHFKGDWTEKNTLAINFTLVDNMRFMKGPLEYSVVSSQMSIALKEDKLIITGSEYISGDPIAQNVSSNVFECILKKKK